MRKGWCAAWCGVPAFWHPGAAVCAGTRKQQILPGGAPVCEISVKMWKSRKNSAKMGKKKEENTCACGKTAAPVENSNVTGGSIESIKVLGSGCKNCHTLFENTKAALEKMDKNVDVEYVTDMAEIAKRGVMSTPALIVNEKVVSAGRVLSPSDVENLLHKSGF